MPQPCFNDPRRWSSVAPVLGSPSWLCCFMRGRHPCSGGLSCSQATEMVLSINPLSIYTRTGPRFLEREIARVPHGLLRQEKKSHRVSTWQKELGARAGTVAIIRDQVLLDQSPRLLALYWSRTSSPHVPRPRLGEARRGSPSAHLGDGHGQRHFACRFGRAGLV
ncbi:hypothetical protein BC567DRAFT_86321 [Phyllosticta citribraziliensis]